jgi:hypothetical protein
MKRITEFNFSNLPVTDYPSNYDETKLNMSNVFQQYKNGLPTENGVGTKKIGFTRPYEASVLIGTAFPSIIDVNDTIQYIFTTEIAAGVNRRIVKHSYNKLTSQYNWDGFITVTMPAGNVTIRGFEVVYEPYNQGTIEANGTLVTGVGTDWVDDGICVGSRIGFGSTDPNDITTWYTITQVNSNNSITISNSAGTIVSGTTYVIEDLRFVLSVTNATVTNGGLFVLKGINFSDFTAVGTVIPLATTVDNLKAVYWLKDASTVTNTISWGSAVKDKTSWSEQLVYVINGAVATTNAFVYDIRKPLTSLSSGASTEGFVLKTGNAAALTGTLTQNNGVSLGTLNHGISSGTTSLFYVTSTRVYRSNLSDILDGSVNWVTDVMAEIPLGGINSMPATSSIRRASVIDDLDSLLIETSNAASSGSYVTKYNTSGLPFDNVFYGAIPYYQASISDPNIPILPTTINTYMSMGYKNGYLHTIRFSTSNLTHQMYSLPILADWFYSNDHNVLITPSINITNATKFYNLYINNSRRLGNQPFTLPYEPIRTYYRTTGISDDSGSWVLLDDTYDLSFLSPSTKIQFKIEFKILGIIGVPPLLYSLGFIYEDDQTDSHYEPSVGNSSISNRIFSWRQSELWLTNIPTLKIKIFNINTNTLILEDDTSVQLSGVWEYSDDNGSSWNAWDNTANLVGNYIRYTANSLPSSVRTRVSITQS